MHQFRSPWTFGDSIAKSFNRAREIRDAYEREDRLLAEKKVYDKGLLTEQRAYDDKRADKTLADAKALYQEDVEATNTVLAAESQYFDESSSFGNIDSEGNWNQSIGFDNIPTVHQGWLRKNDKATKLGVKLTNNDLNSFVQNFNQNSMDRDADLVGKINTYLMQRTDFHGEDISQVALDDLLNDDIDSAGLRDAINYLQGKYPGLDLGERMPSLPMVDEADRPKDWTWTDYLKHGAYGVIGTGITYKTGKAGYNILTKKFPKLSPFSKNFNKNAKVPSSSNTITKIDDTIADQAKVKLKSQNLINNAVKLGRTTKGNAATLSKNLSNNLTMVFKNADKESRLMKQGFKQHGYGPKSKLYKSMTFNALDNVKFVDAYKTNNTLIGKEINDLSKKYLKLDGRTSSAIAINKEIKNLQSLKTNYKNHVESAFKTRMKNIKDAPELKPTTKPQSKSILEKVVQPNARMKETFGKVKKAMTPRFGKGGNLAYWIGAGIVTEKIYNNAIENGDTEAQAMHKSTLATAVLDVPIVMSATAQAKNLIKNMATRMAKTAPAIAADGPSPIADAGWLVMNLGILGWDLWNAYDANQELNHISENGVPTDNFLSTQAAALTDEYYVPLVKDSLNPLQFSEIISVKDFKNAINKGTVMRSYTDDGGNLVRHGMYDSNQPIVDENMSNIASTDQGIMQINNSTWDNIAENIYNKPVEDLNPEENIDLAFKIASNEEWSPQRKNTLDNWTVHREKTPEYKKYLKEISNNWPEFSQTLSPDQLNIAGHIINKYKEMKDNLPSYVTAEKMIAIGLAESNLNPSAKGVNKRGDGIPDGVEDILTSQFGHEWPKYWSGELDGFVKNPFIDKMYSGNIDGHDDEARETNLAYQSFDADTVHQLIEVALREAYLNEHKGSEGMFASDRTIKKQLNKSKKRDLLNKAQGLNEQFLFDIGE